MLFGYSLFRDWLRRRYFKSILCIYIYIYTVYNYIYIIYKDGFALPIHFSWYLTSPESPCENVELHRSSHSPKLRLKGSDTTGAAWMLWDLIGISWAYHGHIPGNQTWMAVKFPMAMEVYSWENQRTKWWICPWPRLIIKGYGMRYSNSPGQNIPKRSGLHVGWFSPNQTVWIW